MEFKEEIKTLNGIDLIVLKNQKELELQEIQSEILMRVRNDN